MAYNKLRWANIVCKDGMQPYLMIVTDGVEVMNLPVENTKLKVVKKTAMDVFDVPPGHILVTEILESEGDDKS